MLTIELGNCDSINICYCKNKAKLKKDLMGLFQSDLRKRLNLVY